MDKLTVTLGRDNMSYCQKLAYVASSLIKLPYRRIEFFLAVNNSAKIMITQTTIFRITISAFLLRVVSRFLPEYCESSKDSLLYVATQ